MCFGCGEVCEGVCRCVFGVGRCVKVCVDMFLVWGGV